MVSAARSPARSTRGRSPPTWVRRFDLEHVYFKLHAACAHAFSPIDAVLDIRAEAGAGAEIEQVRVHTYHAGAILNAPRPLTAPAAKFSIPYCLAAAWQHGRVSEEVFAARYLLDPTLQAVAARVAVAEDADLEAAFPRLRAARVEVLLRDGRRLERYVDAPRGMPDRPVADADLIDKFLGLASPVSGRTARAPLPISCCTAPASRCPRSPAAWCRPRRRAWPIKPRPWSTDRAVPLSAADRGR